MINKEYWDKKTRLNWKLMGFYEKVLLLIQKETNLFLKNIGKYHQNKLI